ncbi:unnamed protein product [Allacma fusca]|uniref:non-specific protein-tyrosine kinase n=1 Tax=Allacma fusca TaxID=39272 RepID=A0A8J2KBL8_9HEXA|nr:unnamed protein product [Allacma fusca]
MDSNGVVVHLVKGNRKFEVPITPQLSAEDVCVTVGKFLKFRPAIMHLFGIRYLKSDTWLPPCFQFDSNVNYDVEFRLRFKLPFFTELSRLDENAFDYCFHQVRHDLLKETIPDVSRDQTKNEVFGLCFTDMLRAITEEGLTLETVENNAEDYIPRTIHKKHKWFLKKKIRKSITALLEADKNHDARFLKEQYLSQMEELAPHYLAQEFHALTYKEEEYPAAIRVDPYHPDQPGVSISYIGKQNWEHLCTIEDLCFVSMRTDGTAEISRKNGIPVCFKFKSQDQVQSFVSHLDGYYRLCEKWTFNLCKDLVSPSLTKLRMNKCHGPVGEKFAHQKLSTHPSTGPGSYILRQSSTVFDEFAVDFISQNKNRPITRHIAKTEEGNLRLEDDIKEFSTTAELLFYHSNHLEGDISVKECLPPSEYDCSPLLLCRKKDKSSGYSTASRQDRVESAAAPQCIPARNLQIFRGKSFELEGKMCKVVKAVWNSNKGPSCNVAIKFLKKEHEEKLRKEFLEMADHCVLWQCDSLVALRGIVLGHPQAMVLDWMPLGPLDGYLKDNALFPENVELIEAAGQIAKALWFLEDHGIVHGNIRCHNVLVYEHTDSAFVVKLADPSIPDYSLQDIHWIPPELYEIPSLAKAYGTADVWALGTTLWQVFSYGKKPPEDLSYKAKYSCGWRLPRPPKCPPEIYRIISECWSQIPDCRKQPQAIVRDIHQILYQLIGSKRVHSYATVTPAPSEGSPSQINDAFDVSSDCLWATFGSEHHTNSSSDGTVSTFINDASVRSSSTNHSRQTQFTWLLNGTFESNSPDLISGFSTVYTNGSMGTIYSTGSAQGIYVFGKDQITLGRMIGQGCYGAVYMGELIRSDGSPEHVAVKMMKDSLEEKEQEEFQREYQILQSLNHPNIVEVKGVVYDPSLLLIMEFLPMGSLLDYFRMFHTKPNLRQLMKFAKDICDGMDYLVSYNLVHRDLAARNILVASDDLVKISDFGLARFTDKDDNCYKLRTDRKLPVKWYPPESLHDWKFSEKSDIWSYGVTLYEIFSYGQEPNLPGVSNNESGDVKETDELQEIVKLLSSGVRLPCPEHCPNNVYKQLMLPCWEMNPQDRPSFSKLLGEIRDVEINLF